MTTKILHKSLTHLLYFKKKKNCTLHRRCFYKYPLFTTFLIIFTVDEVCYISNKRQPLNNLAKHQYFYTRDFISLRHFEKNWHSPLQMFFETSTFYLYFQKWVKFVIFQVNADFLINQLTEYFCTRHLTPLLSFKRKCALSIAESLRNIHFLPHFYNFSQWMRCVIFHMNTHLLII